MVVSPLPRDGSGRWSRWVLAAGLVTLLAGSACQRAPGETAAEAVRSTPAADLAPVETAVPSRPRIVVLGDSLTAGLGIAPEEAYPARLQERLDAEGFSYDVVNAGVSGDTTAGGRRRAEWALDGDVRVLIVALGGNDALRGLPTEQMKDNLEAIIELARSRDVAVLLAGMEAPPNFGEAYTNEFRQVFHDLADEGSVTFVPFLLDGVAGEPGFNQRDGIHPNATGARRVADLLWPALREILASQAVP